MFTRKKEKRKRLILIIVKLFDNELHPLTNLQYLHVKKKKINPNNCGMYVVFFRIKLRGGKSKEY